ncbi:MAG: tetratricopeptide repeat protein, partial [Chthoniobacteraceae bacterium]
RKMECRAGIRRIFSARLKKITLIAMRAALIIALAGAGASPLAAEEALPEAYRSAKSALESGDAAKAVAILESRLPEAKGGQRSVMLFTLGVALLKLNRPADAERSLAEAKGFFANDPKLAETWALLGDARAAQSKSADAAQAYVEAVRSSAKPDEPIARYAAARKEELGAADFLAKGDALSAVGRLRAAAELSAERAEIIQARLGEIAGDRKLRGEATAAATFALGEIEQRGGHLPEAIAYYQRVFVSWLKYPAWVARAYLRAAECFDKLGRRKDAIAHLQEMMRKAERLRGQPELAEARRRLDEWTKPQN